MLKSDDNCNIFNTDKSIQIKVDREQHLVPEQKLVIRSGEEHSNNMLNMCMCVYVCMRERQRERERL